MAAELDHSVFPFFICESRKKKGLIREAKDWCAKLAKESGVISAVVFKATVIPPGKGKFLKERAGNVRLAKYDFAILIEADTHEKIESIQNSSSYKLFQDKLKTSSEKMYVAAATNIKHINPVDHKRQGTFLFNYFYADNLQQNLDVWEYTAGWFQQETGLDNSTVLLPTDRSNSPYSIINHCRWDKLSDILPALIFKRSFHSYVLDNFYANKVAAMPILYKIA